MNKYGLNVWEMLVSVSFGIITLMGLFGITPFSFWLQIPFLLLLTMWMFTGLGHIKAIFERGEATKLLKLVWISGLVVFIPLDVLYNLVVGTIAFRERPKEWLFTQRVQRHLKESSGHRLEMARFLANELNVIDEGHV